MMIKLRGYLADMIKRAYDIRPRRRHLRTGFATLAILLSATGVARADDCIDVESTAAVPDFKPCEDLGPQVDLDAGLAAQAMENRTKPQSDAVPWIATDSNDIPATFSTSDTGVSVRTSLGTWRDYNVRSASPTVVQTDYDQTPDTIDLPKAPAAARTPIDVWSNINLEGYNGSIEQSTRAGVGADYKISKSATFGVSVERGDSRSGTTPGTEEDQKAAAYMTLQASPMLSLDARTEWQAGNSEFAATSGAAEKSAVILAPKVNHSFNLDNGTTVSPYLTYQREFDVSTSHKEAIDSSFDATQSAGAGVTYTKPDAYSLSVSADVDNFGVADEAQSLSSKFQLSVPLSK